MAKNEIKLQYSGFIIFAARLVSVVTGLLFQLMISRSVHSGTPEYDVWFNINDIIAYFTLLAGVIPFWSMRFMARGEEGAAKTGITANLAIAAIATLIYVPLVPLITSGLGISQTYLVLYFLVAAQIIELYSINVFESCLRVTKAHVLGYGLLVSETCKVILGYVLIIRFQQPLQGAIVTLTVAFALQTIYYLMLLKEELRRKIRWEYVTQWLKGSVLNIYLIAGNQIAASIYLMLFSLGGQGARTNVGTATLISNIITYSAFLAFALTPKLLADGKSEDVTTSLRTVMMFALPMAAGALAQGDSYLTILRDELRENVLILRVLALDAILITATTVFSYVLFGAEKLDEKAKISFRELIKSRLFIAFSLPYVHSLITVPATYYILTSYVGGQAFEAALYISIINALARLVTFSIQYVVVRGMIRIEIPWRHIGKYSFASAVMGVILYFLPHPSRIYMTLIVTVVGGLVYLLLLMAIDEEARMLVRAMWQAVRNRFPSVG